MNWRERIQRWSQWPGWRRHAPAAGSVVTHAVVVSVFAGMMAAVTAEDAPRPAPKPPEMSVQLVQLPELMPEAGVTPPPRAKPDAPKEKPATSAPADKRNATGPATTTPSASATPNEDTFYVPPGNAGPTGVAKSLAGLMGDPCTTRYGLKAKECAGRDLAKRTGPMDSMLPQPQEQLAQYFGEFMPKCPYWSGCDGEYLRQSNGTRSVAKGAPGSGGDRDQPAMMSAGAATLGGLNATTGRLGFNPDFRDRGFGD